MVKVELGCKCKNVGSERCNAYVSTITSLLGPSNAIPNDIYIVIQRCYEYEAISQSQSSKSR